MNESTEEQTSETAKNKRLFDYKCHSVINNQESRRLELLENQKRRREATLNEFRNIARDLSDCENEDEMLEDEVEPSEEPMDWVQGKPKFPRLKKFLMFSEWMVHVPDDLAEKWLFVVCPVGKRCLVRCTKGSTTVYDKRGQRLAKFQSSLPNGCQLDYEKMTYPNSEVTILDCIWNAQFKCYFILDLLSWKGQFYMDTETSFRGFWIKSKMQELPWLSERSDLNPYPFYSLNYHTCDPVTISTVMSTDSYFSDFENLQVDGLLFYHSEAYYTPGPTPLVVWLKPFMVPEIFKIDICEMYESSKPEQYVDMTQYITDYEEKQKRKPRRKRGHKCRQGMDVSETCEEDCQEIEII